MPANGTMYISYIDERKQGSEGNETALRAFCAAVK